MLAARLQAVRDHMPYVPGEALGQVSGTVSSTPQQLQALVRAPWRRRARPPRAGLATPCWSTPTLSRTPSSMADVLARQPEVEWAEPNYLAHLHAVPNDSFLLAAVEPRRHQHARGLGHQSRRIIIGDRGRPRYRHRTRRLRLTSFSLWNGTSVRQRHDSVCRGSRSSARPASPARETSRSGTVPFSTWWDTARTSPARFCRRPTTTWASPAWRTTPA